MSAGRILKKTTGLTGLAVANNPHHRLTMYYKQILQVLSDYPQECTYRVKTEEVINHRKAIVESEPDIIKVEQKIGNGQAELLILQARNELSLARKLQAYKPWEDLVAEAPKNQWKWPI